jgi:hypothetical protein
MTNNEYLDWLGDQVVDNGQEIELLLQYCENQVCDILEEIGADELTPEVYSLHEGLFEKSLNRAIEAEAEYREERYKEQQEDAREAYYKEDWR